MMPAASVPIAGRRLETLCGLVASSWYGSPSVGRVGVSRGQSLIRGLRLERGENSAACSLLTTSG